jgi:hypothetical protein
MINRLHMTLSAVCPISGVSVGTPGDLSTVRIDYADATPEQIAAAQAALAAFDWSDAAQAAWEKQQAVLAALNGTMTGLGPDQVSDRVIMRYILTLHNDLREHLGLSRILEPQHLAGIQAAIAAGAAEPVQQ